MPSNPPNHPDTPRATSLWWWVVGAFVLLIVAWTFLINLASDHRPAEVPLAPASEPAVETPEPQP